MIILFCCGLIFFCWLWVEGFSRQIMFFIFLVIFIYGRRGLSIFLGWFGLGLMKMFCFFIDCGTWRPFATFWSCFFWLFQLDWQWISLLFLLFCLSLWDNFFPTRMIIFWVASTQISHWWSSHFLKVIFLWPEDWWYQRRGYRWDGYFRLA